MSDSVQPHRRQPTRLPRPWDSLSKNTGMGCHCLLQCIKVKSESEVAQPCLTLRDPMDCSSPGSSAHFPGKSTGVGCHCLLHSLSICLSGSPVLPFVAAVDHKRSNCLSVCLSHSIMEMPRIVSYPLHRHIQFTSVQLLSRVRLLEIA